MKVVITGLGGQLGNAFRNVWPGATFLDHMDLDLAQDPSTIEKAVLKLEPAIFVNCAAHTAVDKAEAEPQLAAAVNGTAVAAIAIACRQLNARLIQVSTDYVLPGAGEHELTEAEAPGPTSVYGATKLMGEAGAALNPASCVARTSWVFGDGNNFVKTMLKVGADREELTVVDDQVGRPTYAPDLATALKQIAGLDELPRLVNLQNDGPFVSWADFAEAIFAAAGMPTKVKRISTAEYMSGRPADAITAPRPSNSRLSLALAENLGINMPDWRDSLKLYLKTLTD